MAKLTVPQQEVFDALLLQHASRSSELFTPDGMQRRESARADAFWAGYNAEKLGTNIAAPEARTVFLAGKECRRRAGGRPASPPAEKRSPRTIRLSDTYWLNFRSLGSQWLEREIDREMAKRKRGAVPKDSVPGGLGTGSSKAD
jgi:hypothetical protein